MARLVRDEEFGIGIFGPGPDDELVVACESPNKEDRFCNRYVEPELFEEESYYEDVSRRSPGSS